MAIGPLSARLRQIALRDGRETSAELWAESPNPPDPNDLDSKSAKTWAGVAEDAANETVNAAPFTVNSINEFFSLTSLTLGGRYWSKDGGAWDIVSTDTGDFNHPITGQGVIPVAINEKYNALSFMIDPTGSINCAPLLIKMAARANGKQIFFPSGIYLVSTVATFTVAPNFVGNGTFNITVTFGLNGDNLGNVCFDGMKFIAPEINAIRFRQCSSFSSNNSTFDGARIRIIPIDFNDISLGSPHLNGPVSIRNSIFRAVGSARETIDRFIYVSNSVSVDLTGGDVHGTNMYEFFKTSGYTGPCYLNRMKISGSVLEEVWDAYTTWGPIYFDDVDLNMTDGGILMVKSSGNDGPQVSCPKYIYVDRVRGTCADADPFYFEGSKTQSWNDGVPQVLSFNRVSLVSGNSVDTSISFRRYLDVRGIEDVSISNVTGGWADSYINFQYGIHIVGCGNVTIKDSPVKNGSVVVNSGSSTTGNAFGGTNNLILENSGIRGATASGMVSVLGSSNVILNLVMKNNRGNVSHIQSTATRPLSLSVTIASLFLENNGITISPDANGNVNPTGLTTQNGYISIGNDWDAKTIYGSAIPTAGYWPRGSRVLRINPSNGGKSGWICTSAGTPGTWREFGVIDPT